MITDTKITETITSTTPSTPTVANNTTVTVIPTVYLENADKRKDRALMYTMGAGVAMTLYASMALYLDRMDHDYVFYLGLAAMSIIALIFTGVLGLLVKRSINVSKEGLVITDDNYKS